MDRVGEHASARKFFDWSAGVICAREVIIDRALEKARAGEALGVDEILHTRYRLDGREADGEWPNFQLDGFGTLLWAMEQHLESTRSPLPENWSRAVSLVGDYLAVLWRRPCYDCWEEHPDQVHPHTLAAIHAGVSAAQVLTGQDHQAALAGIATYLEENALFEGHFVKYCGSREIDASLLGLAVPYQVFPLDDPRIRRSVELVDRRLRDGGGVHRYAADTYYGGGEWVLLTAWLAWVYALYGEAGRAHALKDWIEAQADDAGQLPEQIPATLNDPAMYPHWVDRWGEIARPLLWSHANYLILLDALRT
jgi:GH15 family glucan-1,4-alpha-glucosidase